MGRIQEYRNKRCRELYDQEVDKTDLQRDYFRDEEFGIDLGFSITRWNGRILTYCSEEARFLKPQEKLADFFPEEQLAKVKYPFRVLATTNITTLPPTAEFGANSVNRAVDLMSNWYANLSREVKCGTPTFQGEELYAVLNLMDFRRYPPDKSIFFQVQLEALEFDYQTVRSSIAKVLAQEYKCNGFFWTTDMANPNKVSGLQVMQDDGTSKTLPLEGEYTLKTLQTLPATITGMYLPKDQYQALALQKQREQGRGSNFDSLLQTAQEKRDSQTPPVAKKDLPPLTK